MMAHGRRADEWQRASFVGSWLFAAFGGAEIKPADINPYTPRRPRAKKSAEQIERETAAAFTILGEALGYKGN